MKINKDKRIGRVLFIVEGSKYEFSLLKKIFVDIFQYEYIEKRRNKPDRFIGSKDSYSRVAVINTKDSNIRDITENQEYLDQVYELLQEKYDYPVDQSAIYFLFDRDPESNNDKERILSYIRNLKNPYENDDYYRGGQLLLSYPSIESYILTALDSNSGQNRFSLGKDIKHYISFRPDIQINKLDEAAMENAAECFLSYVCSKERILDVDNFEKESERIFEQQDIDYMKGEGFHLFSMLTLAFFQMGIISIDSEDDAH